MSRSKNFKNGISMGVVNNILTLLLPFITRTIIIYKLGTNYVGLGGLFTSILQVFSLTELGFNSAITYALYEPIAKHDYKHVNALINLYRKIYYIVGITIVIISLIIMPFLPHLIKEGLPSDLNLYILYFIYVLNTVSSYFFYSYKIVVFDVNERYDLEIKIKSWSLIFQYTIQSIVLLLFENYYIYVLILPISTILYSIANNYYSKKYFPEIKPEGKIEKNEFKSIIKNVGGAFFSKVGLTIYTSADTIVISSFLGLTILGMYQNYYYIISALISLFAVIHNTIRPMIGNDLSVKDYKTNWTNFKFVYFAYMWLTIIICSILIACMQDFELLWVGEKNVFEYKVVIELVIYFFVTKLYSILTVYQEASGIWWQGKFIPLISSIVNLITNIILVQFIGLDGVILSSILSSLFISMPGMSYIIFKYLFKENTKKIWFIKTVFKLISEGITTLIIVYFVTSFIPYYGIFGLLLKFVISIAVSSLTFYLFSRKTYEGERTISMLKRHLKNRTLK